MSYPASEKAEIIGWSSSRTAGRQIEKIPLPSEIDLSPYLSRKR